MSQRSSLRRTVVLRRRAGVVVAAVLTVGACEVEGEGVPEGKVAVVGDVVLGPEDLAGIKAQLGAYAQLRFSGGEGQASLVEAVVTAELLAAEAIEAGWGDDPRVRFALTEELAEVYLAAELERRVPRASVASDTAALRAHYEAHPDQFTAPETRNVEGVFYRHADEAEAAQRKLAAGETTLAELGEIVSTPLQSRDDVENPGFHPILFDSELRAGQWLPHPVLVAGVLIAGRVQQVVAAAPEPFEDPGVQERLVAAVRAPRLRVARAELLRELEERFAEQTVAPP